MAIRYPIAHRILVTAASSQEAIDHVHHFFHDSPLLSYAALQISPDEAHNAENTYFWQELAQGLAKNRAFGQEMLHLLAQEGCTQLADLFDLQPGYPTKVLHILTHLLDGFIGADSIFYNLVEDSHALSSVLRDKIIDNSSIYWLVTVRASGLRAAILQPL